MTFVVVSVVLWGLVALFSLLVLRKRGAYAVKESGQFALVVGKMLTPRLIFALMAAAFLAQLVPQAWIASVLGNDSGFLGILLASVIGGILPGGPMTSFPIAVFMWQYGAGVPQMVALLTGWSVFALHRMLAYELPIMGWHFTAIRLASTCLMPPLAGLLAAAVVAAIGPDALTAPH